MSADVHLDAAHEGGKKSKKHEEHKEEEGGLWIKRSEFFIDDDSGRLRNARTHKETKQKIAEKVHIPEEKIKDYIRFLTSFAKGLLTARESDPQQAAVLRQNHPAENSIVDALVTTDSAGNQTLDEKKIEEYVRDPDHLMVINGLREERTKLKSFAIGQAAIHLPSGERRRIANEIFAATGRRQGPLNKFYRWLPNPVKTGIGAVASLAGLEGYLYASHGVQAAAFGGALLGLGIVEGMAWALRNGDADQLKFCKDAFDYIRNDPAEAAYVKAVFDIDVNDYVLDGGRIRSLRQRRNSDQYIAESGVDVRALQDSILSGLQDRREFYEMLGVPLEKLDASPEQSIYAYLDGSTEQLGTHWQREFTRHWNPNEHGIVSRRKNPTPPPAFFFESPGHLVGGNMVPNNDFDRNNIDVVESLKRMAQAKQETMLSFATRSMVSEQRAKLSEAGPKAIKERLSLIKGGKFKEQRDAQLERQARALEEQKNILQEDKSAIDAYTTAVGAINTARQALQHEFPYESIPEVNSEIERLRVILEDDTGPTSFAHRLDDLKTTRDSTRVTRLTGVTGSGKSAEKQRDDIEREVTAAFDLGVAAVDRDKQIYKTKFDRLTELRNKINTQLNAVKNGDDIVAAERRVFSSLETDRNNLEVQMLYANAFIAHLRTLILGGTLPVELVNVINGPNNQWTTDFSTTPDVPPPATPTYWRANIDIRSLHPQEITARLNFIHNIRNRFGTFGWNNTLVALPPGLSHIAVSDLGWSQDTDRRRELEHARIEERALNIEPDRTSAARVAPLQNRRELQNLQIWDNDLVTRTPDEIYELIEARAAGVITGWLPGAANRGSNINIITAIKNDYINNIYHTRLALINNEINEQNNVIIRLRARIQDSAPEIEELKRHLDHAEHLAEGLPALLDQGRADFVLEHLRNPNNDTEYVFNTSVMPADNPIYAPLLRDAHLNTAPRGYADILRTMLGENDIMWATHLLTQERMAEMLNDTLRLGLTGATKSNIVNVLTTLNTNARICTPSEMRRFFIRAVNYVGTYAVQVTDQSWAA